MSEIAYGGKYQYFKDLKLIFTNWSIRVHDFSFLRIEYLNVYKHMWHINIPEVDVILLVSVTNRYLSTRACEHMSISPFTSSNVKLHLLYMVTLI